MKLKLRFKEFGEDWKEDTIGNVFDKITDFVAAGSFADLRKNVIYNKQKDYAQLIRTIDIKNNFKNNDYVYINENAFKFLWRVNLNDKCIILPNIGANIGEVYYINPENLPYTNNALGPNAILLESKNSIYFLFNFFQTIQFKKSLSLIVAASGQPKFNKTDLKQIKLKIPSLPEQTKIADFLSTVDEKIQNEQDKITHLENIKKGFMQKIFSRKIRFKDDDGNEFPEWEEKKLKDCCEYKSSSISTSMILESGEYELFDANGKIGYTNTFCDKKYISIIKDGAGVGRIRILPENSFCISTMGMIISNECCIIEYLYYMMCQLNFTKYVVGGAIPHIYFKDYGSEKIGIPCLEEQRKIADLLLSFDEKIDVEKDILQHLKEMKKGLLQQLFV